MPSFSSTKMNSSRAFFIDSFSYAMLTNRFAQNPKSCTKRSIILFFQECFKTFASPYAWSAVYCPQEQSKVWKKKIKIKKISGCMAWWRSRGTRLLFKKTKNRKGQQNPAVGSENTECLREHKPKRSSSKLHLISFSHTLTEAEVLKENWSWLADVIL